MKLNINFGGFFTSLLTLIFVVAKILGLITWSWWLVFAPIWAPLAILGVIMFFVLLLALIH